MRPLKIKHSVWGVPPPPVCIARWDQDAWDRYADSYRPTGYDGGRFDSEAWEAFKQDVVAATAPAFPVPTANMYWRDFRSLMLKANPGTYEVEERTAVFVGYRGGLPDSVLFWHGAEAARAQRWLRSVAFHRCCRTDCGIRLGPGQKLGSECRNHK